NRPEPRPTGRIRGGSGRRQVARALLDLRRVEAKLVQHVIHDPVRAEAVAADEPRDPGDPPTWPQDAAGLAQRGLPARHELEDERRDHEVERAVLERQAI